jgi:3-isopropylmalate dehydrogenase
MLKLRKTLDCYANIRPALFPSPSLVSKSPLKEEYAKGTSIVLIRELVGGIYFGARQEADFTQPNAHAWDRAEYSVDEVVRIARVAGHLAMKTNPPTPVHSIDKANVLATSRVWRYAVTKTFAEEFPTVPLDHTLVDAAAMLLAAKPKKLNGIIVTDNIFGDILSDEIAVISGSIGVLPSASLNGPPDGSGTTFGLYEPMCVSLLFSLLIRLTRPPTPATVQPQT